MKGQDTHKTRCYTLPENSACAGPGHPLTVSLVSLHWKRWCEMEARPRRLFSYPTSCAFGRSHLDRALPASNCPCFAWCLSQSVTIFACVVSGKGEAGSMPWATAVRYKGGSWWLRMPPKCRWSISSMRLLSLLHMLRINSSL